MVAVEGSGATGDLSDLPAHRTATALAGNGAAHHPPRPARRRESSDGERGTASAGGSGVAGVVRLDVQAQGLVQLAPAHDRQTETETHTKHRDHPAPFPDARPR